MACFSSLVQTRSPLKPDVCSALQRQGLGINGELEPCLCTRAFRLKMQGAPLSCTSMSEAAGSEASVTRTLLRATRQFSLHRGRLSDSTMSWTLFIYRNLHQAAC